MKAIVVRAHGGIEALQLEDMPIPVPEADQVLVQHKVIGVNFVDVQHRRGEPYPITLPFTPGIEAAGVVEAVGRAVNGFRVGDRVAYAGPMGSVYGEFGVVNGGRLVHLPDATSFELAASVLLQGMTAHALTESAYRVQRGDVALIHAAAGGVGSMLVQMCKRRGATVIATASSPDKAAYARELGADHTIATRETDFAAEVQRITSDGVNVVYDAVGRDTFDAGLRLLRARGHMVIYGLSSGSIPPFDINRLSGITGSGERGSLFVTWATLNDYNAAREDLLWRARDVLTWAAEGTIKVRIAERLPLAEAARAHELLESRGVVGKVVLIP
jgi:NADPH:quinone reductase